MEKTISIWTIKYNENFKRIHVFKRTRNGDVVLAETLENQTLEDYENIVKETESAWAK